MQLVAQGMRNEVKVKNATRDLLWAQSRRSVANGNTHAKTCNHSANVTNDDVNMKHLNRQYTFRQAMI